MAVLELEFRSEILGSHAQLMVILPSAGERGEPHDAYQTLWMVHGGNGDCTEWIYNSSLPRYAQKYNLAVVLPSIYNGFGVDMAYGTRYATFLQEELIPAVRFMLPCLSDKREDNFVAGVSMGGFTAFRWAMNKPGDFSVAGSFAGAIATPEILKRYLEGSQPGGPDLLYAFGSVERITGNENDVIYMLKKNIAGGVNIPKLYMFCGVDDFGFELNQFARDEIKKAGAELIWEQGPGGHSFDSWDPYIPSFFDKLPTKPMKKSGGAR